MNRRQVEAWEQRAIEDVRDGRVESAITAYAEHERIRAFDGRDDRDRALIGDWWQAHQAAEDPVIYAHRRVQVDRLNHVCQRLRAEHGELGPERLAVGDLAFAVGDRVVLGANALERLGVANGTSAEITALDVRHRTMTVRTVETDPPRTVRLPAWYLDGKVKPSQSRRVDFAYARTDMCSQGRTEQRALLALDGAEDMQGFYVQLSRSKERTDLYLTVGPEPLGDDDGHGHPRGGPVEPERLLARVMTRDGSKTLASDSPTVLDVRRLSTRQLRQERDQLAALRATCPADRSRELRLARERASELDAARRVAGSEHQVASEALAQVRGGLWHRREQAAAVERLTLAEHAVRTTTRQAGQAAERAGWLRRVEQDRSGWLERHTDLPQRERLVARELAWRGRVDARALALDPPTWLLAELGPVPERPAERDAWTAAAVELESWRRAYGLDGERPAKHGGGQRTRAARAAATSLARQADRPTPARPAVGDGPAGGPAQPAAAAPRGRRSGQSWRDLGSEPLVRSELLGGVPAVTAEGLLGTEPDRRHPGRRRDWQQARAALERLAAYRDRTRDLYHQRRAAYHEDRPRGRQRPER